MKSARALILFGLLVLAAGPGCGGGGAEPRSQTSTTTIGQELIDLKAAYDKGVITLEQYEDQKKKILERE